jgi:hypothetical protein
MKINLGCWMIDCIGVCMLMICGMLIGFGNEGTLQAVCKGGGIGIAIGIGLTMWAFLMEAMS